MKYIRTNEGIYEVEEIRKYFLDEKQKLFINNTMRIAVNENKVIAQADTIEELCDRFVFEYKLYDENGKIIDRFWREYHFMDVALETFNNCKTKDKVVYGAIITDKGLIYVAKLNDKGELVLI